MSGWLLLLGGLALAGAGTTIAVAAAAVSRLELVRWISQRLRGAAIASALLTTPRRLVATAGAAATLGTILSAFGFAAVLGPVPRLLTASAGVILAVPVLIAVGYALPRGAGRRWPDAIVRRAAPGR